MRIYIITDTQNNVLSHDIFGDLAGCKSKCEKYREDVRIYDGQNYFVCERINGVWRGLFNLKDANLRGADFSGLNYVK